MSTTYDPKEIPDLDLAPPGRLHLKVAKAMIAPTDKDPRLVVVVFTNVVEPEEAGFARLPIRFYLGSKEDPQADEPVTRRGMAWKNLKQLFAKAGLPMSGKLEEDVTALVGAEFGGIVTVREYTDARGSQRSGNDVKRYLKIGDFEPALAE